MSSRLKEGTGKREQEDGGAGEHGAQLSPQTHQECTSNRSAHRIPAGSGQEYLTSGEEPRKTRQDEGSSGETGVLVGLRLPSAGGGTEAGVQSPHQGNYLRQPRNI